jgi:hypothetical protein
VDAVEEIVRLQNRHFIIKKLQVYVITAEELAAWRASEASFETFFGFDAEQLKSVFGSGSVLSFSENTPAKGEILTQPSLSYDGTEPESTVDFDEWFAEVAMTITKSMAVILVSAALAPLSGGSTFVCAFSAITKMAATTAAISGSTNFAIQLIMGLARGNSFHKALEEAGMESVKVFADSFLVGALVGGATAQFVNVCFPENTFVLMADGTLCSISQIRVGDEVLCYDTESGEPVTRKVSHIFTNVATELVKVETADGSVFCTNQHPFYTRTRGWIPAEELTSQDLLLTEEGVFCEVLSVTHEALEREITVYNAEVEDCHNYFVSCGDSCILVHNQCVVPTLEYGPYGKIKKETGYAVHHMPASKYMTSVYSIDPNQCPSIKIATNTHYRTFSFGRWSQKKTDFYMNLTPDEALRLDISSLKASLKATGQWTDDMAKTLDDYVKMCHEMFPHLFGVS